VDLLYGDRRFHKGGLRDFLDLMDGFAPLPVFVLATTNDKTLVDHAASRPGRFDMILEVDELDNRYLAALVAGRCRFPEVACLFDEDVLETLMRNKASGAFIVNIIKNLELRYELSGEKIGKVDVMNVINGLHKGFYRDSRQSIGFSQED
jgi:SpoVK/Ycf46/Vps4 family AAA+-type ATPase